MRQRNIPVTQKVSAEAQTDIKLVREPVYQPTDDILSTSRVYSVRQSHLLSPEGIIRPQSESVLLSQIRNELELFRGLKSLEGISQADLKKRLLWLQAQVEGLEKRSLSFIGADGSTSGYYNIVGELQSKLDRQAVISNNYEPKIRSLNTRIEELEAKLAQLRTALLKQQEVKDQNQALKEAFREINDVARDPKKMREFEKTVNTIIVPLMNEVDFKLETLLKNTTVVGRAATTPQNRLKTQVNLLMKGFDRLVKGHADFTIESVEGLVGNFLKEMELQQTFQNYAEGKLYKHLYEDLKGKFAAAGSIYKNTFETVVQDYPELKTKINLTPMDTLQQDGIEVFTSGNTIVLEPSWGHGRTVYYQTLQSRTKNLISLMGKQFKRLLAKYPKLKEQLGAQLLQFLSIQMFDDAIALQQMQRIVQVVKYQPEVIKVQNVYQYNSDKNMKAIFHLRIMIKTLLEELLKLKDKTGAVLEIDEGLLGMIRTEIIDLVDTEDVLRVFRSIPKIVEVDRVVEKDLGRYLGVLTQAHPLNVESAKIVDRVVEKPVVVKDQVGIIMEKGITTPVIHQKAVFMSEERVIQVPVEKEVIVEKVITNEKAVEVEVTREVPIKEIEYHQVEKVVFQDRVVEIPKQIQTQVPYETTRIVKQIVEIPRYEQRLVEVLRDITNIKEVRVTEQVPMQITKYIQLQKIVNNFVKVPQLVQIKEQIPITITNTVEKPVDIIETIEKIVVTKEYEEKLIEVPVRHEVAVIQEVPVPYKEEVVIVTKGDREEVIREVQRIVEKPIIREVLKLKEIEVEKAVPVWLREQKPVQIEVSVPYIQYEPQIVSVPVEKWIPYREQVPVEVVREIPVPIVLEKEVIKQVRVMVEKIVEKMVQVPRVVEVEKIVEKIVVVPRVIENIVHVPQIIERIVERQVEVLKIVEIQKPTPIYLTNQVKQIVKEQVPYPVEKIVYQPVEKQKIVVMKQQSEVIREVGVQTRIPVEVIVQRQIPMIVEKIIERLLTIHDVEIHNREVILPYKYQEPVELVQERAVEVRKIIENILQIPQVIQKQVVLYETKTEPEIHTVYVEKPIEVEKEVVYTDVRNVIEKQIQYRDLIKEKLVKQTEKIQVLRPEPYIVEKVVYTNQIHQQGVQVVIQKGTAIKCDQLIEVQRPVNYFSTKQIPKNIYRDKLVEVRTFVDQLKQVIVNGPEKVVPVHSIKPEVVQVTEQVVKYLNQEVEKRVFTEVPVREEKINLVEVPGKTVISHETQEIRTTDTEPVYAEKIVERVILLPQILEILKHVHDISEVQSLGIATGVDIDVHRSDYIAVCKNLKAGLEGLLVSLKGSPSRSAELKAQITLIQQLIPLILELIQFPTIIEVPKQVEKIVQKQKVVVVPTKSQDAIDREVASTSLIDKLVAELKRLKSMFKVELQLDEDIKNIFFAELKDTEHLDLKLQQFTRVVLDRFHSLGNWTSQHSLMLNSFLQERFLMAGIIKQCNDNIEVLKQELEDQQLKVDNLHGVITKLNIHNITLKNTLEELILGLGRVASEAPQTSLKNTLEGLAIRGRSTIDTSASDPERESRYVQSQVQSLLSPDLEKVKAQNRLLESELETYKGGQANRNQYLSTELGKLKTENQNLRGEVSKLRLSQHTPNVQNRQSVEQSRKIQELSRQLHSQQEDYERKLKSTKAELERELQQSRSRVTDTKEEDRLRMINKEQESKIGELEEQLVAASNAYEHLKFQNSKLKIQQEARKRQPEIGSEIKQQPTTIKPTTQSGRQAPQVTQSQLRTPREAQRAQQEQKKTSKGGAYQSPEVRGSTKLYTPADQLKFQSPELRQVRTQQQPSEMESGSSRLSGSQYLYQRQQRVQQPKRNLTVRQLINQGPIHENVVAILIIKIVQKIQEETGRGRYMLYAPESIHLMGYSPDQPDQTKIKLGDPINKSNEATKLYLAPQVLRGQAATEKSCIFNIGVIWDEMLHRDLYFHNTEQIENIAYEYRVRNNRTNPIFKNSLFEMLSKEPRRRLGFTEIRRRLSLQQFIVLEEEGQQDIRRRL